MTLPTDDSILFLHNPRCSKSRAVLAILEAQGVAFTERRYLEDPLLRDELVELGERLARPVQEWTRQKEQAFSEAGLSSDAPTDAWFDAMTKHAILMERPIVVRGGRAVVGRPPEAVRDLLGD